MRSEVGGWVRKRFANCTLRPVSGFTMYACAWAGLTCIGIRAAYASIFASALARASGSPEMAAPAESASYSRDRLRAVLKSKHDRPVEPPAIFGMGCS